MQLYIQLYIQLSKDTQLTKARSQWLRFRAACSQTHPEEAMSIYWGFSITVTCKNCGKKFYISDRREWAYKIHDDVSRKYFCSWSCLRNYEKEIEEAKRQRRSSERRRTRYKN